MWSMTDLVLVGGDYGATGCQRRDHCAAVVRECGDTDSLTAGGELGDDQWQAVFESHKIVRRATGWGGDLDYVVAFGQNCSRSSRTRAGPPAEFWYGGGLPVR